MPMYEAEREQTPFGKREKLNFTLVREFFGFTSIFFLFLSISDNPPKGMLGIRNLKRLLLTLLIAITMIVMPLNPL